MKQLRVIKLVPTEFINEARDLREISVLIDLGCEIIVVAKETTAPKQIFPFPIVRLSSRPISPLIKNATLNRMASLFTWQKEIRKMNPDVLSCHDILCLLIGWISNLFKKRKAKLVYDSHEFEYARNVKRSSLGNFFVKHLERFLIKKSSLSIMVNKTISEEVQKLHHLSTQPVVVRNIPRFWNLDKSAIESRKVEFKRKYGIKETESLIIYQGGIMTGRGLEKSIEAMSYIDDARLVLIGGGNSHYILELTRIAESFDVKERVIFHPAVPHEELQNYTGMADVGLCNIENVCLSYYYSLPNKLFEYIQALVPIVGSSFPEICGIIKHYGVGECCQPNDAIAISSAIKKVLIMKGDVHLKENLAKAKKDLCWEQESKILYKAYHRLISSL